MKHRFWFQEVALVKNASLNFRSQSILKKKKECKQLPVQNYGVIDYMLLLKFLFDVSKTLFSPILWVSLLRSKPASGTRRTIRGGEGEGKRYFHHNTVLTSQYNTTSSKVRTKDHYFRLWEKRLKHFKNIWLFQQNLQKSTRGGWRIGSETA